MKRFQRILLPTDGSEFSAGAERVAFGMARQGGVKLAVMTIVLANGNEAESRAILDGVQARAAAEGLAVEPVLRHGEEPHKEIVAEAEKSAADVIVMGRRGKRGLARLMLGDATVKVIGAARCPVLVVPKACAMWSNRLLLATDGSKSGEAAAQAAAMVAHCCGTPITVVSVRAPHHSSARQDEAERAVDRVLRFCQSEGVKVDGAVASGVPHKVIAATAAEKGADLIVMGSHGRTGLGRLILGSNSERVIGEATCPVLVVKG